MLFGFMLARNQITLLFLLLYKKRLSFFGFFRRKIFFFFSPKRLSFFRFAQHEKTQQAVSRAYWLGRRKRLSF